MQIIKPTPGVIWLICVIVFTTNCEHQYTPLTSRSPDGKAEASVVVYSRLAKTHYRVDFRGPRESASIHPSNLNPAWDRDVEYGVGLCEFAWAENSRVVAVLISLYHTRSPQLVWFAYDFIGARVVDPEKLKPAMIELLKSRYGEEIRKQGLLHDPFGWALSSEAAYAFRVASADRP